MPQPLPENWKSLNVGRDLRLKGSYPQNLTIFKVGRSNNLRWRFLPDEDIDPREFKGRTNKGKGKRKWIEGTTGISYEDPREAGKQAIKAVQLEEVRLKDELEHQALNFRHSLAAYFQPWFEREIRTKKNPLRWSSDTKSKWDGEAYGINKQPFAHKSIELVDHKDIVEYFSCVDSRGKKIGRDMAGTKKQQKTLIKALFAEARKNDFPQLQDPIFPTISERNKKQPRFLSQQEWDDLLAMVVELSGGNARKNLSKTSYEKLDWSLGKKKTECQRNWVDLYDALHLQYFFFLRAQDMALIKTEWFKDEGTDINGLSLFLEETKGDRKKYLTVAYRKDAYDPFWKRLIKRRPKGHLILPYLPRTEGRPTKHVPSVLNELLCFALDKCGVDTNGISWTTIRHTSLYLTLLDFKWLGEVGNINRFAENAHTSSKMLQETYLDHIDRMDIARRARKESKPSNWSLMKSVPS